MPFFHNLLVLIFILCFFHTFDKNDIREENITWVLLDTRTGKVTISKKLKNDFMAEETGVRIIHYFI